MHDEPKWLKWLRELQALSQSGLAYATNDFERERYQAIRKLAAEMLAAKAEQDFAQVHELFEGERGYATPKIDVRAAVFDDAGRILLVRERLDQERWSLPGGWADVNLSAAQNAVKEVIEESGFKAEIVKLAAVWDRTMQQHPARYFSCYKIYFVCRCTGGSAQESIETAGVGWFAEHDIPTDLSLARVLPSQIQRMFEHHRKPELACDFD